MLDETMMARLGGGGDDQSRPEPARTDALGWLRRHGGDRFFDLDLARRHLASRSERTATATLRSDGIELVANDEPQSLNQANELRVAVDGSGPLDITHWAFGQLAQRAGAPAGYLRQLPGPIVRDALIYGLRYGGGGDVEVKALHDGRRLRALTSPTYGRVDDAEVIAAVEDAIDTGRWAPAKGHMGCTVTDRVTHLFLTETGDGVEIGKAPDGSTDVLRRGIRISNSQVGAAALRVEAFLFRDYCLNGMIFGLRNRERISVRHTSGAPARWVRQVEPAIREHLEGDATGLLRRVEKARERFVAEDNEAALRWLRARGLRSYRAREAIDLAVVEEGRPPRTGWEMIQAITAAARDADNPEARVELEQVAGTVFDTVAA